MTDPRDVLGPNGPQLDELQTDFLRNGGEIHYLPIAHTKALKFTCIIKRAGPEAGGHQAQGVGSSSGAAFRNAIADAERQGWL